MSSSKRSAASGRALRRARGELLRRGGRSSATAPRRLLRNAKRGKPAKSRLKTVEEQHG